MEVIAGGRPEPPAFYGWSPNDAAPTTG